MEPLSAMSAVPKKPRLSVAALSHYSLVPKEICFTRPFESEWLATWREL